MGASMRSLRELADRGAVVVDLDAATDQDVIELLAAELHATGAVEDRYGQACIEREQTDPTGLPSTAVGIAIPHGDPDAVIEPAVAVGRPRRPARFRQMGDPDEHVDAELVFLLALPVGDKQLRALRQVVEIAQDDDVVRSLLEAADAAAVVAALPDESEDDRASSVVDRRRRTPRGAPTPDHTDHGRENRDRRSHPVHHRSRGSGGAALRDLRLRDAAPADSRRRAAVRAEDRRRLRRHQPLIGLLFESVSPAAQSMAENFGVDLTVVDVGWPASAAIAFGTRVGALAIPVGLAVNVVMLGLRLTKTLDIDLCNYWHIAFSGAIVGASTGSTTAGLVVAAIHMVALLALAD